MNIIDQWKKRTTCKDCLKGTPYPDTSGLRCEAFCSNVTIEFGFVHPNARCDEGLWLAEGSYGESMFPMDLWKMARLLCDYQGFAEKIKIIPREEWPEVNVS